MSREIDLWRRGFPAFRTFGSLQKEMNELMENWLTPGANGKAVATEWDFSPSCDVEETDKAYLVTFDLPGIPKENLKIEISDNVLSVSGERTEEKKEDKRSRHLRERFYGKFQRSFTLPMQIDADHVEAGYREGVLKLVLPKTTTARTKEVKVT